MTALEVQHLEFRYLEKAVLDDLSFTVDRGDFFGIIGPNGAGKSTLLKILGRVLDCQSGTVNVFNRAVSAHSTKELARLIAFVPQETHFSLEFRVEDIIRMGRYPHLGFFSRGTEKDLKAAFFAMEQARILTLQNRMVNSLSAGERQRVIIGRALAQEPKILLLDEPTSHLDLKFQFEIMKLLKQLNGQGLTVVCVSHDLNLASLYCSRIMLLNKGRIEVIDRPERIVSQEWLARVYSIAPEIVSHPKKGKPQILMPG